MNRRLMSCFVFCLVTGCSLIPAYHRPEMALPVYWNGAATQDERIAAEWWHDFGSAELNSLVKKALTENNDIRAAIDRIRQARATAKTTNAALLPSVAASAGGSETRTLTGNAPETTTTAWNGGLNISYEVDLLGANHAKSEAAAADITASIFDRDALALTVMGDVAKSYFNVLGLREQVTVAQDNLKTTQSVMEIINARFRAGAVSGLEVAQQRETVEQSAAALATLVRQEAQAEHGLAVLEGVAPQDLRVNGTSLKGLVVPALLPTQPSALLTRRPDIRAAEERLIAANADIGAARAAFFPTINLATAATLMATPSLADATKALAATSSLTAPIFEAGALRGQLELTEAQRDELVETYRKAVLTAFQEVEDALAALDGSQARELNLKAARKEAQVSYDLSLKLYKAGGADFQTLLNAQRDLLNARTTYVAAQIDLFTASVDLFKALGGGWKEPE